MNEKETNKDYMIQSLSNQLTRSNLIIAELEATIMMNKQDADSMEKRLKEYELNEMNSVPVEQEK